jgi:hypothetical protein
VKGFFIHAVILEELRVVPKVPEEPIELPKGSLGAVQTTREESRFKGFGFQNDELNLHKRLLRMPPVTSPFYTNKKQTFQFAVDAALIQMKPRNLSPHGLTSTGWE